MRLLILCLMASFIFLAAGIAGTYKGTYSGSAGASGDFIISLTQAENGDWKGDVAFTLGGANIKTTIKSLKVDAAKVRIVYEFDLQGTVLESTVNGELDAGVLMGDYKTRAVADGTAVDEGNWKATLAP